MVSSPLQSPECFIPRTRQPELPALFQRRGCARAVQGRSHFEKDAL